MLESESPIRCWYHTGFGIAQSISFRAHVYHTEPAKATTFHTTDSCFMLANSSLLLFESPPFLWYSHTGKFGKKFISLGWVVS